MTAAAPSFHGLCLAHYAALRAALAEGFGLVEVLAVEGVEARAWKKADLAWKKKLAGEPALFGEFERELAAAEDWLERRVKPIEGDPGAWVGFLHAYTKSADPIGLLAGAGLGLNDVARLGRKWARRVEGEQALGKKLAELSRAPREVPRIEVDPKVLRRSRVAEGRGVAVAAGEKANDEGPTSAKWAQWLDARRSALRGLAEKSAQVEPEPAPVAPLPSVQLPLPALPRLGGVDALQATAPLPLYVAPKPATPFVEGAQPTVAMVAEPKPARTAESMTGTALVVDVPRGAAMPFAGAEAAKEAHSANLGKLNALADTAPVVNVPRGPALPFLAENGQEKRLDVTAPVVMAARGPALPFGEASRGENAQPRGLAVTGPIVGVPKAEPLPFVREVGGPRAGAKALEEELARTVAFELPAALRKPAKSAAQGPELSLEQYAALCAELAAEPGRAEETFARYGLGDVEVRKGVDEAWKERLRREPELYREWQRLFLLARER